MKAARSFDKVPGFIQVTYDERKNDKKGASASEAEQVFLMHRFCCWMMEVMVGKDYVPMLWVKQIPDRACTSLLPCANRVR